MSEREDERESQDLEREEEPDSEKRMGEDEGVSPSEAFSALGNEVRVNIIRELGDIDTSSVGLEEPSSLTFSELYNRVGAKNTSQFSYHLDQLKGNFVRETEEGYSLTFAGIKVIKAILSGTYNELPEFGRVEINGYCPNCENNDLVSNHENGKLYVECTECESKIIRYFLSPGQAEGRTSMEVMRSYEQSARHDLSLALKSICPECSAKMETEVRTPEEVESDEATKPYFVGLCQQCKQDFRSPVDMCLVNHPAVISFYWDHGIDLTEKPMWELFEDFYSDRWTTQTVSVNPHEFLVKVNLEDDELKLRIDNNLEVKDLRTIQRL